MTANQKNFRVRNGLTIDGATSGSSSFASTATGTDLSYVLPGSQGASNTVLTNDGSGNLSWALPGGGGSTFGNITIAVATDNTISTTTGPLILTSATSEVDVTGNIVATGDLILNGADISTGITNTFITANRTTTNTNNPARAFSLKTISTGTPTVGFGTALEYQVETAASVYKSAAAIEVVSTDVTTGSEDFQMNFRLMTNGAAYSTKAVLENNGNLSLAGDLDVNGGNITNSTGALTINPATGNLLTLTGDQRTRITRTTATTNIPVNALEIRMDTSGTPAVGFGTSMMYQVETASSVFKDAGYINVQSTDITSGQEDFQMNFGLITNGSAATDKMTLDNSGNLTLDGYVTLGNGAVVKDTSGYSVAFGVNAGQTNQGNDAVAIGLVAGQTDQGLSSVAVGEGAGNSSQGTFSVAVGANAGNTSQGEAAVAIGNNAGAVGQGNYAIAIGSQAGNLNQPQSTIILNATDTTLPIVASQTNSFYVAPIRNAAGASGILQYDTSTCEVTYSNSISVSSVIIDNISSIDTATHTTTSTTPYELLSSTRTAMDVLVTVTQGADVHVVKALVLKTSTTTAMLTTYGEMYDNIPLATFSATATGGAMKFVVTPVNATSMTFNAVRTSLD